MPATDREAGGAGSRVQGRGLRGVAMEPYYQAGGIALYQGDALDVLRRLPDESVQMCVTSPPYWGLRDNGIPPQTWGAGPQCDHVWGAQVIQHATNHVDKRRWNHARNGRGEEQPLEKRPGWKRQEIAQGNFCVLCGAWHGVLGLEPTPELYVAHVVEIFREVRRTLKNDGTLWLNLGDCYATGAGKACAPGGGKQGERFQGPTCQPNRMPIAGLKPKDLVGMPWRVAFALQADGWYLRSDIVWHKPNPMPESVTDRPTRSHEYLFLLAKSQRYYYDAEAIREPATGNAHDRARKERSTEGQKCLPTTERNGMRPGVNPKALNGNKVRKIADGIDSRLRTHIGRGIPWAGEIRPKQNESFSAAVIRTVDWRNKRTVWTLPTRPYSGAHFATFPPALVEPCILAGARPGDVVMDPFGGAGTTALVARQHGRGALLIELKPEYCDLTIARIEESTPRRRAVGA